MGAPKVERFSSALVPLPAENVDTDQIVPARYLKVVVKSGLADALFHDWRFNEDGTKKTPPFVLDDPRYAGRSILVSGDNFGTGSSREHAPWALDAFGIKAIVSTSFADIFKNNALKNGILPIVVDAALHAELMETARSGDATPATVDLASATLTTPSGATVTFTIDPFAQKMLLAGLDELDFVRSKVGFGPKLCHDVHSHLSGINAVEFCRRVQPYQMFFIEDVLSPEQLDWYKQIRQNCTTPQAVGEVFSHPLEFVPLVTQRLIDFVRCRVSGIGGITPAKKLATLCEYHGVRTAFQEGGENDPINQLAAYHVDISHPAFGIQEENAFPPVAQEMLPGCAEIRGGYLYGSGKPGLGIDINEQLAAKHPIQPMTEGGHYRLDRTLDGAVVKP